LADNAVGDLTTLTDLESVPDFMSLWYHSSFYMEEFLNFLSNPKYNWQQKLISIYSIQKLPFNNYIYVFNRCIELYKNNIITEEVLKRLIFTEMATKNHIIREYKNKDVINALEAIRTDKRISNELKNSIKEILDGTI
jgi:hypothetical protein